ncbi:uncharacterized protein NPIL_272771 [Nephila pilipes]|uniref:Uncharacterized protein n=1 Tax=Nephila pilipes TaxID=299642 RepID=A0A8X6QUI6_NEPPI|nr:uncharacterized protein NPIL_272771 [Nephila pilipes]
MNKYVVVFRESTHFNQRTERKGRVITRCNRTNALCSTLRVSLAKRMQPVNGQEKHIREEWFPFSVSSSRHCLFGGNQCSRKTEVCATRSDVYDECVTNRLPPPSRSFGCRLTRSLVISAQAVSQKRHLPVAEEERWCESSAHLWWEVYEFVFVQPSSGFLLRPVAKCVYRFEIPYRTGLLIEILYRYTTIMASLSVPQKYRHSYQPQYLHPHYHPQIRRRKNATWDQRYRGCGSMWASESALSKCYLSLYGLLILIFSCMRGPIRTSPFPPPKGGTPNSGAHRVPQTYGINPYTDSSWRWQTIVRKLSKRYFGVN